MERAGQGADFPPENVIAGDMIFELCLVYSTHICLAVPIL